MANHTLLFTVFAISWFGRMAACAADPAPSPSGSPAAPSFGAAMALLQSGDASGAVKMMEAVVKEEPDKPYNWRLLGQAAIRAKELDRALAAFQRVHELQPDRPPFLKLAAVHALKGNKSEAFSWLEKAKASGRADMSELRADEAFKALRDDPRFNTFLPTPDFFTRPFVEDVKIIREWDGEGAGDQFGWIARSVGDVNGDGAADFVTSAPTRAINGANAGRVYVYSTRDGKLLWQVDGKPGDMLGSGIEAAGDTNGDGINDVVAGAPSSSKGYIYSGKDGHVLQELKGESKDDTFGNHVAGVGDVDGDSFADVIIGAPNNSAAGKDAGRAYIYSGKDGHLIHTFTGEAAGDQFGSAVSGSPDGKSHLIVVGAPGAGPNKRGRVYVYDRLKAPPKFKFEADETGAALGAMFVSIIGDVNKDGQADVYASDWPNNARGPSTGRIYVHSGKDGRRLFALTGENQGAGFGTNPGRAGDIDGDGYDDILLGSWQYAKGADSAGAVFLYSGRDAKLLKTYTCRTPGDTFGFDAVGVGDIDGDQVHDLLITSGWSGVNGHHSGRVFLISSGISRKVNSQAESKPVKP
ncbi:MAG TPA: tetratricopeptide repeat protein [Chthoniobacterales bacterium]|nr:tetratricopeptide repeat protein [Chthoniobacterales bacterium]